MSSTADIIYIYKDGPEFPDSELTGEQQLAEQRAYVESFAKFEEEEANDGDDKDEHASDSGTGEIEWPRIPLAIVLTRDTFLDRDLYSER